MLEPMNRLRDLLTSDIRTEVKIVVGIVDRASDQTADALKIMQMEI